MEAIRLGKTCSAGRGWGLRGTQLSRVVGVVSLCLACAASLMLLSTVARAEKLSHTMEEHLPELVQWAYHNAGESTKSKCGFVCARLWSIEESLPTTSPKYSRLAKGIAELELGTGQWGSVTELAGRLLAVPTGSSGLEVGWQMGNKWMRIVGPAAPGSSPPSPCKEWSVNIVPRGKRVGSTFFEEVFAPENAWYLDGCGLGEIVGQRAPADNPEEPGRNCGDNGTEVSGWSKQEWIWNECYEGNDKGSEVFAPVTAQAFYVPLVFGIVHPWEGQKLEGEFAYNVGTLAGEEASLSTLEKELKRLLEEESALREWVNEVLPLVTVSPEEEYGMGTEPQKTGCREGDPVNCATGNEVEIQTDLSVGGRGPGLALTRSYNSQQAVTATEHGPFGYGWTGPYSAHITTSSLYGYTVLTVHQQDGSAVRFVNLTGTWEPLGDGLVHGKLVQEHEEYIYTPVDQTVLRFAEGTGLLTSIIDRNGNAVTMHRGSEGRLESVSDAAGRSLTFTYNSSGEVESAKDPMGHVVKYTYESGNLASVTLPGGSGARWKFKYNASHEMTSETDGRGHTTTTEYDGSYRVIAQTDPLERKRKWEYFETGPGSETTITEPSGAKTVEVFNSEGQLASVTRASGTSIASTTLYEYDGNGDLIAVTDPDKHKTTYGYNEATGDRTSETDPLSHETKWEYNSTHDVTSTTTPRGEKTTIKRDSHGNVEAIERPAPLGETEVTKFKYDSKGDLESVEDALKHVTSYEYDSHGDRTVGHDPEGDKRTWAYDEDSNVTSSVSPRGHASGAKEESFTTKIERDEQERPKTITDPLGHTSKYVYDADGNVESYTDGNSHTTKYEYDADSELIKVTRPNSNTTKTGYSAEGQVTSETDGNEHTTKYERNLLGETTEIIDPLKHTTTKEYDPAGNLKTVTDPLKRTTTYSYDADNHLVEVTYSDGKTHAVKYEYDEDGDRTKIEDASGTTEYEYDQLDRLRKSKDGHGNTVKYTYNLDNAPTELTYPNGETVSRGYDKDGRLESVKDWLSHTTTFAYDPDSDLTKITYPSGTSEEDKTTLNDADQITKIEMKKSSEVQASLTYTLDNDGQVKTITQKGVPGEEKPGATYDENNRLTKLGTTEYKYDAANNPTKTGSSTNTFNAADELEKGTSVTYSYDELDERTKRTPTSGPATTYAYDQAGNLASVTQPKEGEKAAIEDSYTYNGEGLRTSETIAGSTNYLAWDNAEAGIPLLLSNGSYNFIYGPGGVPIEQISSGGTVTYLHHDQAGSTRLLTGSTGTVTGKCTYSAYGAPTCEGTTTTPLGYDGEYTSSDTGLVYLRHRVYDPATGQFLSVDPLEMYTGEPYGYAGDNPLNYGDPRGLAGESIGEGPSCPPGICFPFPNGQETERAIEAAKELGHEIGHTVSEVGHGIESVWNEVTGGGESSKESTQTQSSSKCGEPRFNGDQDALIKIAKEAQRNGLSPEDAEALREWAEEYDVPFRGPEEHPTRGFGSQPHVHVGPVDHIPVG
jgi:RHS repeat-associated protein